MKGGGGKGTWVMGGMPQGAGPGVGRRGGTEGGVEGEGPRLQVDAGVVADKPGEAEHQGEVRQSDELKGNVLCMRAMDPDLGGVEVGDRSGRTPVDKLDRDGRRVGGGL